MFIHDLLLFTFLQTKFKPSKKHIVYSDTYSICKISKSVNKTIDVKLHKHADQSASYSGFSTATVDIYHILENDTRLPCISLINIGKTNHKPFESALFGISYSPLKSVIHCEQFSEGAADPIHSKRKIAYPV